jgi:mannose/fructose/N-acetylgalactosamine-specific phosphotransferase system component IID
MMQEHETRQVAAPPAYPEITRAQWAVLSAWTDQRCEHMMEAADFVADLSPEAKKFLRSADKEKIEQLNSNMEFFATSKSVWKFLWIGGGVIVAVIVGASQAWKAFGEFFTIKIK